MLDGFVNVLKPVGATASDIVVKLRRVLGQQKIGHLGTLDPGACGVLPIAIGKGTKLFNLLTNKTKLYRAVFTFGTTTDTLDSYGVTIGSGHSDIDLDKLRQVCAQFVGDIQQIPPMYSAISVGGARAYDLARQGQTVELKSRTVSIYNIDNIYAVGNASFSMDISCSGGTYIRSLGRDIADMLGTVAYMSSLVRLQSGCFCIEDALTYDEIDSLGTDSVLDLMYPLADMATYEVPVELYKPLSYGVAIPADFDDYNKIYCQGEFFGIGKCANNKLVLEYYLRNVKD